MKLSTDVWKFIFFRAHPRPVDGSRYSRLKNGNTSVDQSEKLSQEEAPPASADISVTQLSYLLQLSKKLLDALFRNEERSQRQSIRTPILKICFKKT